MVGDLRNNEAVHAAGKAISLGIDRSQQQLISGSLRLPRKVAGWEPRMVETLPKRFDSSFEETEPGINAPEDGSGEQP